MFELPSGRGVPGLNQRVFLFLLVALLVFLTIRNLTSEMTESERCPRPEPVTFLSGFAATNTVPSFQGCVFGDVGSHIKYLGSFAPCETLLFQWLLSDQCREHPETIVADVGGNVGYFAMYAAMMGCQVHTFEPTPIPLACINTSIVLNNVQRSVSSYQTAIGDFKGHIHMSIHPAAGLSVVNEFGNYNVPVNRLPDFFPDPKVKIFLLKIDIEGYEGRVFETLYEMIAAERIEHFIVEVKTDLDIEEKATFLNAVLDKGFNVYQYFEHYGETLQSFEHNLTKCITEVKQLKSKLPVSEEAKELIEWEDFLITKKPIPPQWEVTALN